MMTSKDVRSHYVKAFGEPSRVAHYQNDDVRIEILKWDADKHPEGVAFYATVGRSVRALPGQQPTHRVEFFVGLLPPVDEIARSLADLAACSNSLAHGSTFTRPEPLWTGTSMNAFLICRPIEKMVPPLEAAGHHVIFDQAIPLYPEECAFVIEHGAEALRDRWNSSQVPFWNPERPQA
jgi:hypothetical protein